MLSIASLRAWVWNQAVFDPIGLRLDVGRSVLASGTLITLIANSPETLFHQPFPGRDAAPHCESLSATGLFCITQLHPELGRWLGIVLCLTAIIGLVPLVSSWLFWYVAASLFLEAVPIDGGDQLTASLAFFIAIISLTDRRLFAWRPHPRRILPGVFAFTNAVAVLIPAQVAFVYLNAAIAKFAAPAWVDGTALWYWIQHPGFNATSLVETHGLDALANPFVSATFTWGAIALELSLAAAILLAGRAPRIRFGAVIAGILFHVTIALLIGLVSFCFAMSGALILALWRRRDDIAPTRIAASSEIRNQPISNGEMQ